jgi:Putative zinc-finger
MNGKCLDIGTIQAFLDGETSPDVSLELAHHIGGCPACADRLALAEDENSFVFSALDREMNTLVPTQRLWSRINESIEVQKSTDSIWRGVYAFIATSFVSPSLTTAAGLLLVFTFMAVMWTLRSDAPTEIGFVGGPLVNYEAPPQTLDIKPIIPETTGTSTGPSTQAITVSNHSSKELENLVREANRRNEIRATNAVYYGPLPGEHSYLKTITDLKETVDGRKDAVFNASGRVAFERDLAVVNDAIKRTQKVVRSNPRNQAARQVLYSAYQDKIDLLNTVAQRDELIASTR